MRHRLTKPHSTINELSIKNHPAQKNPIIVSGQMENVLRAGIDLKKRKLQEALEKKI